MCLSADTTKVCRIVAPKPAKIALGASCAAAVFPNPEGAGYYRFTLDQAHRDMLVKGAGKLDAADQLTLFHNLFAAVRAGLAPAGDVFTAVHEMAPTAQWDLIVDIKNVFHDLRTNLVPPDELPAYRAFVRDNFGPRLEAIGLTATPGEAAATVLARQHLVDLLVEEGGDPVLLARLAKAAQAYIASNGKDYSGLPPDVMREAMRAGAISGGAPFMDSLIAAYKKSNDEFFFASTIYAAAGSDDRAALDKFLAFALTPQVRTGDLRYVLRNFSNEPVAQAALWHWFTANFDTLLKRVSRRGMGGAPGILAASCTVSARADLDTFFAPKVSELEGARRTLAQTDETISRCIAIKQAKGAELVTALHAAAK
jgi:alanyl aminopeptidase